MGRYAVGAASAAGHDVVVLARSKGVNTLTGDGLARALDGVGVIIDATNAGTAGEAPASEFFATSTANLQRAGAGQGVRHLVVLSIVGIDRVPAGYYAAKLAHERAALAGPVPATILRATQFHEFPAQMISRNRQGSVSRVPNLRVQTVAARTVGRVLAEVAAGAPQGRVPDLAGPEQEDLVTLARRLSAHLNLQVEVHALEPELPAGVLIPGHGARIEGPSFGQWLATSDAASMAGLA